MVYGWTREDFLVIPTRANSNLEISRSYGTINAESGSIVDEDRNELEVEASTVNIMDVDITLPIDWEESVVYQETELEDDDIDDS